VCILFPLTVAFAQKAVTIDAAIDSAVAYLEERIPAGAKVVVLNVEADSQDLSSYVIDSLFAGLVNSGKFTVVDRANLVAVQNELSFQASGAVSDETAQRIGNMIGAESIISGNITGVGKDYRFRIRAIEVETATVQGAENYMVRNNGTVKALTGDTLFAKPERPSQRLANISYDDKWKYKRIYTGLRLGAGIHNYNTNNGDYGAGEGASVSFDFAGQITVQLLYWFGLQYELAGTADRMTTALPVGEKTAACSFASSSLVMPLLARFTVRPANYAFSLIAGPYVQIPTGDMTWGTGNSEFTSAMNVQLGAVAGASAGLKLGPGVLFLDARYWQDFDQTRIRDRNALHPVYNRSMATVNVGYEIGFIDLYRQ
jgi:hypothetical protein